MVNILIYSDKTELSHLAEDPMHNKGKNMLMYGTNVCPRWLHNDALQRTPAQYECVSTMHKATASTV